MFFFPSLNSPRVFTDEVNKLRNILSEKEQEIKTLKDEVKALNNVQRRQARAIKELDVQQDTLPKQYQALSDENGYLKTTVTKLQQQQMKDLKTITTQADLVDKLKEKLGKYEPNEVRSETSPISPRPQTGGIQRLQDELDAKQKTIEVNDDKL